MKSAPIAERGPTIGADALHSGLSELGLVLDSTQTGRLTAHVALIQKWTRIYNLTAIRDASKIVSHHLLDSLAIVPHLSGLSLLDVGTGAGLPGIPVAIARPDLDITLLDSNSKKIAFLRQAIAELGLKNVRVVCARVESWRDGVFDMVVSRAFSEIADFVAASRHLLARGGVFMAMKGINPVEEIGRLPAGYCVRETTRLNVPGLGAERHLVVIGLA